MGLLLLPMSFARSGILMGNILVTTTFMISFLTQYYVMKTAGSDANYTDTLMKAFGKKGYYFGMVVFIIMLFNPIMVYV